MAEKNKKEPEYREENLYTIGDKQVSVEDFAIDTIRRLKCPDCSNKIKCQITKEQRLDCVNKLKIFIMTDLVGYNYDEL